MRERENDDVLDYRAREEAPEPYPTEENDALRRRRKERADRSEAWRTEAGVYKNWRPPNWGAENSRRL